MQNLICYKYCASPFCEASCPTGAICLSTKDNNIYVDTDKCNRCGICREMCVSLSVDENLKGKRPWIREDFGVVKK
jgi:Fe-S-cluster-containing hydrogenase component 2